MNKEQQRIKIAKACGWKSEFVAVPDGDEGDIWIKPDGFSGELPDYLNDLNAMHEAEKTLSEDNRKSYRGWLVVVCCGNHWHATAAQRAEAFLRTLNLWKA